MQSSNAIEVDDSRMQRDVKLTEIVVVGRGKRRCLRSGRDFVPSRFSQLGLMFWFIRFRPHRGEYSHRPHQFGAFARLHCPCTCQSYVEIA